MKLRARRCVMSAMVTAGLNCIPTVARGDLAFLNSFAPGTAKFLPYYLSTTPAGQVVVADPFNAAVNVYAADGTLQFPLIAPTATPLVSFGAPTYAALGPDGDFYVSDSLKEAVLVFSSTGQELRQISGGASFYFLAGIAINSNGIVYLASAPNSSQSANNVYVYNTAGTLLYNFVTQTGVATGLNNATGLAIDSTSTNVFVASSGTNLVDVYSPNGNFEYSIGGASGASHLNLPLAVSVSGTGLVYVSDSSPGIKVYTESGTYLETVATTANGQAFQPVGVAVSPEGMVYVTPSSTSAVYRYFDPASWATGTNAFTNPLAGPTSVAVGAGGLLGSTLTLNSSKGLAVAGATTVNNGGIFTLNGGTLNTGSLVIDGATNGANFTGTSGSLNASVITVTNGGVADFAGSTLSVALTGGIAVNGSASQFKIDQGAIFSASSLNNSGQTIVGTGADLIIFNNVTNNGTVNLTGGELDIRGALTNALSQTIQGTGTLSTTLGFTNSGTLALSGSSNLLGPINNSGGTIHLSGNTPNIFYGSTINTGTLTVDSGASGTFYGAYNGSAASAIIDNGSLYLNANSVSGSISGSGNLTIGSNSSTPAILTISPGSNAGTLSSLSVAATSSLNLTNSALVVHAGSLTALNALVAQGYNGGKWNGSGISSSAAGSNASHLTALGAIVNDNGHGVPLYGTGGSIRTGFDGTSPVDGDILIKYTYYGDANLDGKVDGSDYARIDSGYLTHATGWFNGDFNYDGIVDGSDYTLIDNAFNMQGVQLTAEVASATSQTAVPEPGACGLVAVAMAGLRRRRRQLTTVS